MFEFPDVESLQKVLEQQLYGLGKVGGEASCSFLTGALRIFDGIQIDGHKFATEDYGCTKFQFCIIFPKELVLHFCTQTFRQDDFDSQKFMVRAVGIVESV